MAQAIHLFDRTTSRVTATDTNFVEVMDLTAAELSGAGFQTNDEVLILLEAWLANAGTSETSARIQYNNSSLIPASWRYDFGAAGVERAVSWMGFLDLGGTLADLDVDIASSSTTDGYCEISELKVIRLADLGTEDVDWHRDHNTTVDSSDNVFTSGASVTFTPASVNDWVIIAQIQSQLVSTDRQWEIRLRVDGSVIETVSMEPESGTEEWSQVLFYVAEDLAASSHTIDIQYRHEATGSDNHEHQESRVFVFRADVFTDMQWTFPGSVNIATATSQELATLTGSVSTAQDAILLGSYILGTDTGNDQAFAWTRQGGSTVIDPVVDQSSGLSSAGSYDATDQMLVPYLSSLALSSGAQDLDFFGQHNDGSTLPADNISYLLWGMELTPLGEFQELEGSIDGTGALAGDLVIRRVLAGSITGDGTLAGELVARRALAGSLLGDGVLAGGMLRTLDMAGSLAGVGTLAGAVLRVRDLAGALSGTGSLTGELVIVLPAHALSGTIQGLGSLSGSMLRTRDLAGSVAGAGTVSGVVVAVRSLAGQVVGTAEISGRIVRIRDLAGSIVGEGILSLAHRIRRNPGSLAYRSVIRFRPRSRR